MNSPTPEQDIAAVARVSAVPHILQLVTELTGMHLHVIARVTSDEWTACAVNYQVNFGLQSYLGKIADRLEAFARAGKD